MADIESARLVLRLLPVFALEATAQGKPDAVATALSCALPDDWPQIAGLAAMRLKQLQDDPSYLPWSIRAVVLRQTNTAVGYINFHARPHAHPQFPVARNMAEIGYTIFPSFRRQGYAREALAALLEFARSNGAGEAVLSIAPDNVPSLRLAAHFGFDRIGTQIDEIDGPEEVFLLRLEP